MRSMNYKNLFLALIISGAFSAELTPQGFKQYLKDICTPHEKIADPLRKRAVLAEQISLLSTITTLSEAGLLLYGIVAANALLSKQKLATIFTPKHQAALSAIALTYIASEHVKLRLRGKQIKMTQGDLIGASRSDQARFFKTEFQLAHYIHHARADDPIFQTLSLERLLLFEKVIEEFQNDTLTHTFACLLGYLHESTVAYIDDRHRLKKDLFELFKKYKTEEFLRAHRNSEKFAWVQSEIEKQSKHCPREYLTTKQIHVSRMMYFKSKLPQPTNDEKSE